MRRSTFSFLCALLLTSAVGIAQTKSTTGTKVTSDNGQVVTLTGCVMIGGATNFLLTVTSEREPHDKQAAPAGGSYALIERDNLDLGRYINQRVELTGVVVPAATKGDNDDKIKVKDQASATRTVKVARGASTQFIVASVKMLSPVCGQ